MISVDQDEEFQSVQLLNANGKGTPFFPYIKTAWDDVEQASYNFTWDSASYKGTKRTAFYGTSSFEEKLF